MDIDLLIESDGLYVTTLPDGASFTWRLLSIKEYRVFSTLRDQGIMSEFQVYDQAFNRCFVGDSRAINGNLPAGIFLSIGELIMYLSGDCTGEEGQEIDAARAAYSDTSVTEVMKRVILMAFPSYVPDVFESWTRTKLTRTFVTAEAILQNKSEYQPMDTSKIMSPAEAAKQSRKANMPDIRRDNQELGKEFGDRKHALDRHPSDLSDKAKKTQAITRDQARHLDRMERDIDKRKKQSRSRR